MSGERVIQAGETFATTDVARLTLAVRLDLFFFGANLWTEVIIDERDDVLASTGAAAQTPTKRRQRKKTEKRLTRLVGKMSKGNIMLCRPRFIS